MEVIEGAEGNDPYKVLRLLFTFFNFYDIMGKKAVVKCTAMTEGAIQMIFIVSDHFWNHSAWGAEIRGGIDYELRKKRYQAVYLVSRDQPQKELEDFELDSYFTDGKPRVVCVIGSSKSWLKDVCRYLDQRNIEVLLICHSPLKEPLTRGSIMNDYHSGVEQLISHLRDCGCTKTALYGYYPDSLTDELKLSAYREHFGDRSVFQNVGSLEACYRQFRKQLEKFDSVLCVNDITALSLANYLRRDGIAIPDRIQLACFSSSKLPQLYKPSITSIVMNYHLIGRQTVSAYSYIMRGNSKIRLNIEVPGELVLRDSTRPVSKSTSLSGRTAVSPAPHPNFFKDSEVNDFSRLNLLIGACDKYDLEIIGRYLANQSTAQIAEALCYSQESIRYRIRCLANIIGLDSSVLIEYIRSNQFSSAIWE